MKKNYFISYEKYDATTNIILSKHHGFLELLPRASAVDFLKQTIEDIKSAENVNIIVTAFNKI